MKSLLSFMLAALALVSSARASAGWSCDLECKISGSVELDRLPKHSSGPDYGDFMATCREVHHGTFHSAESGCENAYCLRYENYVSVVKGSGVTLTDARRAARAQCSNSLSTGACGVGLFKSAGQYSCRQF